MYLHITATKEDFLEQTDSAQSDAGSLHHQHEHDVLNIFAPHCTSVPVTTVRWCPCALSFVHVHLDAHSAAKRQAETVTPS